MTVVYSSVQRHKIKIWEYSHNSRGNGRKQWRRDPCTISGEIKRIETSWQVGESEHGSHIPAQWRRRRGGVAEKIIHYLGKNWPLGGGHLLLMHPWVWRCGIHHQAKIRVPFCRDRHSFWESGLLDPYVSGILARFLSLFKPKWSPARWWHAAGTLLECGEENRLYLEHMSPASWPPSGNPSSAPASIFMKRTRISITSYL